MVKMVQILILVNYNLGLFLEASIYNRYISDFYSKIDVVFCFCLPPKHLGLSMGLTSLVSPSI